MDTIRAYIKQIRLTPLLSPKEEIQLSREITKGNRQARQRMINANLRLVINIARRYSHLGLPLMDLIEEGNIGLMRAVDKFSPNKGCRFSTYATWWIRQSMIRAIFEQVKIIHTPAYLNELLLKWKRTSQSLSHKLKRPPSNVEIAKKMKLSKTRTSQITNWLSMQTSYLEAPLGPDGSGEVLDLIEDETAKPPDAGIDRLLKHEIIKDLLDLMSPRERDILDMRFGLVDGKQHTLAEIAKKIGVSRERVRQIELHSLKKLKKYRWQQEKKTIKEDKTI